MWSAPAPDMHSVYIDITRECPLRCDFCMYRDKRSRTRLPIVDTRYAIGSFISHSDVSRVTISGEGEPLSHPDLPLLLEMAPNACVATSGAASEQTVKRVLGYPVDLRVSLDSFHIAQLGMTHYESLLRTALGSAATVSLRSLLEERETMLPIALDMIRRAGHVVSDVRHGVLEDDITLEDRNVRVVYRNMVDPADGKSTLDEYLRLLEISRGVPFTLGNRTPAGNGMSITIKPDSTIEFYGAETQVHGVERYGSGANDTMLFNLSIERMKTVLESSPIILGLYTVPFRDVIAELRNDPVSRSIIERTNNPYWIVRRIPAHTMLSALASASGSYYPQPPSPPS